MAKNAIETDLSILLIDDEKVALDSVGKMLKRMGFTVFCADRAEKGLLLFQEEEIDIVISDIKMPGMDGIELVRRLKEQPRDIEVILITAHGDLDIAVEALKAGSFDFLTKPVKMKELLTCLQRTQRYQEVHREKERIQQRLELMLRTGEASRQPYEIVGESRVMQNVLQQVERVAQAERTTVLITGESGTGKELIARAIHRQSPRASGPFISVNCTAIPENLLESELFGHEKGAFTDAREQKKGLFELGSGGTFLLDEIGDMAPLMQTKLLRVLEERKIRPVGGEREAEVDVRLISATNQDLGMLMEEGRFRQDLYYRVKVFTIEVPPLRTRGDDVLLLAYYFLQEFAQELRKKIDHIDPGAQALLKGYEFPGNVRELRNLIERAAILCEGSSLKLGDLQVSDAEEREMEAAETNSLTLAEIEKRAIQAALRRADGKKIEAARSLGIDINALSRRMKKYSIN